MEADIYFKAITGINEQLKTKEKLYPTLSVKTSAAIAEKLNVIDKDILSSLRGNKPGNDNHGHAVSTVQMLLSTALENPITEDGGKFCKEVCRVLSMWNNMVLQSDEFENYLRAVSQLVDSTLTLKSLLLILKQWVPQLRQISTVPLADDMASHWLKMMKEDGNGH
jgi:hypothetical protein